MTILKKKVVLMTSNRSSSSFSLLFILFNLFSLGKSSDAKVSFFIKTLKLQLDDIIFSHNNQVKKLCCYCKFLTKKLKIYISLPQLSSSKKQTFNFAVLVDIKFHKFQRKLISIKTWKKSFLLLRIWIENK